MMVSSPSPQQAPIQSDAVPRAEICVSNKQRKTIQGKKRPSFQEEKLSRLDWFIDQLQTLFIILVFPVILGTYLLFTINSVSKWHEKTRSSIEKQRFEKKELIDHKD